MSQHPAEHRERPRCVRVICEFGGAIRDGFLGDIRAATHWLFADDARARNFVALIVVALALLVMAFVLAFYFAAQLGA